MDPMKQIYAQGWVYRKAVSGRTSPIVFWGMWLIFGPMVIATAFMLIGWSEGIARGASLTVLSSFEYGYEGIWVLGFMMSAGSSWNR